MKQFEKNFKIGVISQFSLNDRRAMSGTHYKAVQTLKKCGGQVVWLKPNIGFSYKVCNYICRLIHKLIYATPLNFMFTRIAARLLSSSIDKKQLNECDVIFASFSSTLCYKIPLAKEIPLVYMTDAVWHSLQEYYNLGYSKYSINEGDKIEKFVLNKADIVLTASQWCKDEAVKFYSTNSDKIRVIPFGANIDEEDIRYKPFVYEGHLDILFLGVDWERKGGNIALEAVTYLNSKGIPATLHVVGADNMPKDKRNMNYVNFIGMLDKNNDTEREKLIDSICRCHILLLPTLAECFGIVFCECSAYGIPVYTHATGGIPSVVSEGVNGRMLKIGSTGKDFAKIIINDLENGKIEKMSITARELYCKTLNWDVWGEKVSDIINELTKC